MRQVDNRHIHQRLAARQERCDTVRPSWKQRLTAKKNAILERLKEDELVRRLMEKKEAGRTTGAQKLAENHRRKAFMEEAAKHTGFARVKFFAGRCKFVTAAALALLVATVFTGVGLGAGYLAGQNSVLLVMNGSSRHITTNAETVRELLEDEGITLTAEDRLSPHGGTVILDDMQIRIESPVAAVLTMDGESKTVTYYEDQCATVDDLLEKAEVTLGELDMVEPSADTPLSAGMQVRVFRGAENIITQREVVPYAIEEVEDSTLPAGTRTVHKGRDGEVLRTCVIRYADGVECSRETMKEEVLTPVRNEVIVIGTYVEPQPLAAYVPMTRASEPTQPTLSAEMLALEEKKQQATPITMMTRPTAPMAAAPTEPETEPVTEPTTPATTTAPQTTAQTTAPQTTARTTTPAATTTTTAAMTTTTTTTTATTTTTTTTTPPETTTAAPEEEEYGDPEEDMEVPEETEPVKNTFTDNNGREVEYLDCLSMMITAYSHAGNPSTALGGAPRATRSRSNPGTVAVAPQTIPYHTLLYVPGYGYCLAEDTGGFRFDRPYQIDVFMDTETECNSWGRKRNYPVYIVEYGYYR